jgi:TolB-like protein/DNA-binding winged helix-turn-helix (wHTH) protein/Tfp pilus assembly protein PilF
MDVRKPGVRFGPFAVDPASGRLRKHGVRIRLQEQPFQVLLALIEQPGAVVTREELHKQLWPDTIVDYERGLNKAVNRLRDALGDDSQNPKYIETLPQRGYRFLAPVERETAAELAAAPREAEPIAPDLGRRRWLAAAGGLGAAALAGFGYLQSRPSREPIDSIAVLPLENLSDDPEQEYFSDGMTDELIGEIARIGSLRVISRTSVMRYKEGPRKSIPEIARELNVAAVLEGTVTRTEGRVRISAQLIRARDDSHIWSARYERDVSDALALQSEVARAVAEQIRVELSPAAKSGLNRGRKLSPEAHEAYLRGRFFVHRGIGNLARSIDYFTKSAALDPGSTDAHAGLAEALVFAGIFGLRPPQEAYPQAREAAFRALALDDTSAPAHNALADVKKGYEWDMSGAELGYRRALELNPSHLLARLWRAEYLARVGRFDESLEESQRAIALDPVSPHSRNNRAMLLFRARRFEEAIRTAEQAFELDPHFVNAFWWKGMSHVGLGDLAAGVASLTQGLALADGSVFRALLGHAYGRMGSAERPWRN